MKINNLQFYGTNLITKISYIIFVFYLIIIHLPDFVESLCLIIPNLFIFLIWYLIPSRVIPINWANSFWVISGFAWIVANIFSWVAISFLGGSRSKSFLKILLRNTFNYPAVIKENCVLPFSSNSFLTRYTPRLNRFP